MIPPDYTGPAVWRNASEDKPVNILSCLGEKGGLLYFQDDSDSPGGIPGNQLFLPLDPTNRQAMLDHYINILGWGLCYCDGKNPEVMGAGWQNRPILKVQDFPNGHNIGLNHAYSKTVALDIDHPAAKIALAAVGIDLDSLFKYRYKIIGNPARPAKPVYRLPAQLDFKPETKQLKWPCPTGTRNRNGTPKLITIFELRTGNHQDILPPSIHPETKQPYTWENVPESPQVLLELPPKLLALLEHWNSLEPKMKAACPWLDLSPKYDSSFDVAAVQKGFNEKYTPGDILERNGYAKHGDKWLCPNSSTGNPGVIPLGDGSKIMSFHGSDPLGDGKPHDAYDCAAILEYGGDYKTAWHMLKNELGITFSQNGKQPPPPAPVAPQAGQPAETESDDPPTVFKRLTLAELIQRPAKNWLIDGLIGQQDLAMIFGDAGTGKTFAAVDLIFCAILERQFAGKFNINRPLAVAYCASEGIGGLAQRFCAGANHYQIDLNHTENFSSFLDVPQLFDSNAITSVHTFVNDWRDSAWGNLDLLIIDTLHGATWGADENLAKDAGLILRAMKYARDSLNCSVLLVHHANRAGNYRGSSALHGAMDSMFQTKQVSDGIFSFECFKQKDAERFAPLYFKLTPEFYSQSAFVTWLDKETIDLNDDPAPKTTQAKNDIISLLRNGPLNQSQIIENLKRFGQVTIRRALSELESDETIQCERGPHNRSIYSVLLDSKTE